MNYKYDTCLSNLNCNIMKNNIKIYFFKSIFCCLLQIEQKEVETLEIELKEKVVSLSNLQKDLEQEKVLCC